MKRITKLLCIFLVITITIIAMPTKSDSFDIYTYQSFRNLNEVRLLQNQKEAFLVGSNGKNVHIERVYPETYSIERNLENNVYSYGLFDSTLVMICPNRSTRQTQIVLYDIYTDTFTQFLITDFDSIEFSQFVYSDSFIYISNNNGIVKKYSTYGELITTYSIHHSAVYLSASKSGEIYAIANNGLFLISDDGAKMICDQCVDAPISFISNDVFVNDTGYYYKIGANYTVNKLIASKSTVYYPSGGIIDNHSLIADNNILYGFDITSNAADRMISFSNYIEEICLIDSTILALSYQNGAPVISKAAYTDMIKLNQNSLDIIKEDVDTPYCVTSNIYTVDNEKQTITGINYSTTISEFKSNIYYDGFKVSFTRYDGKEIKSGNIGTATIARFYNEYYFIEYELSVVGDLTGEGNVNSRDKKLMFSYLLDEVIFSGVYLNSADIDKSNKIDTVDLVLLLRTIEEQK